MSLSTHFMADKMKSLCFLKNIESNLQEEVNFLPLVATGSWDEEVQK
jgi:hypothetical protein